MSDIQKDNRIKSRYMTLAAEFLKKETSGRGMITVTGVNSSRDHKFVTILITVFPDTYQDAALAFTKRKRSEFREYVKEELRNVAFYPTFDFAIDMGEKNRQKIDSLVQKTK